MQLGSRSRSMQYEGIRHGTLARLQAGTERPDDNGDKTQSGSDNSNTESSAVVYAEKTFNDIGSPTQNESKPLPPKASTTG